MASEKFTYEPTHENFAEFIRNHKETSQVLPELKRKKQEAGAILLEIDDVVLPENIDPKLIPDLSDQGLILTEFDDFEGMHVAIPKEEQLLAWEMERDFNLRMANHPLRLEALRELESKGFTPPPRIDGILDQALREGQPLQLSDLAQNTDFHEMNGDGEVLSATNYRVREEIRTEAELREQVHRTELLATGPFSYVGRRPRNFIGMGAMPDIMGSTLMCETALQMGSIVHLPEVGQFSDPDKQAALVASVLKRIYDPNNPLFEGRSQEDIDFMKDLWSSSLVGVLEVDKEKALRRADKLAQAGVRSFRVYGHTQGGDVVTTTEALRREYPDAEIFASQITNVSTALACEYAGADAIVIGVGSGGRCSTADRSQLIPSNAHLPWALRGKLDIPIIGEGGAIDEPIVSLLVGMSGVYGSGSLGGGTLEAPGGVFYLRTKDGDLVKPYGGEASDRFKSLSGRTYGGTGLPYFSEGKQTFKKLELGHESMTQNMVAKWEDVILGAVVMGIDKGPDTLAALQQIDPSPLWKKSGTTQFLQKPH